MHPEVDVRQTQSYYHLLSIIIGGIAAWRKSFSPVEHSRKNWWQIWKNMMGRCTIARLKRLVHWDGIVLSQISSRVVSDNEGCSASDPLLCSRAKIFENLPNLCEQQESWYIYNYIYNSISVKVCCFPSPIIEFGKSQWHDLAQHETCWNMFFNMEKKSPGWTGHFRAQKAWTFSHRRSPWIHELRWGEIFRLDLEKGLPTKKQAPVRMFGLLRL
jgi:hypothetical protein